MGRSLKKGPYVENKLVLKVKKAIASGSHKGSRKSPRLS